jgi:NADH:ubiquinone reductase (H+-translocating)
LIGKGLFIEGYVAKMMYRSLYLMHDIALQGVWRTLVDWIARGLSRRAEPEVKLH